MASANSCSELTVFISVMLRREPRGLGVQLHFSSGVERKTKNAPHSRTRLKVGFWPEPQASPTHIPSSPRLIGEYRFSQEEAEMLGNKIY